MGLSIHTNFASLTTQNQLNSTNKMLGTAMQRLGTGLRINSAADDAAGLQMATRLQAQSNGQKVGMRNAQDAVSMMQTAEGAMDEMTNIVQRMKDLATQGANGTTNDKDRLAIGAEMKELSAELKNIRDNTTFAGEAIIADAGKFGAGKVTFQIGGTAAEKLDVDVSKIVKDGVNKKITDAADTDLKDAEKTDLGQAGMQGQIKKMDDLLADIGQARSSFGANINRLEHTVNNLSNMKENTDMANGRIMDADFAQESTNMTKNQMLMQAGMSVLSNSNQMTGMVTSLLR
ncbi:lateral flagellin LafA [Aeromonas jandaei]|uniref:lateral flagellin LafA n=1 Tax=Aeromonas TaxID=642 RepID=UPI000903E7F1|nr:MULTISPECIES: lateral flagellin LafA [Aeromonas]MBL0546296.1 lateral flagellin LafA [Aeromonas jandaei]MBL0599213.1 lateral flagellin LafA [Aeromonas jandaei]MBL0627162.1 lateral flagellin LafA [Aeromonas jandaei]MBM0489601.1 Lateral flagellin [Aeromonas jandaei]MBM0569654.1 Lateral flagellin [Aeromonas jandaei]